jgi:kynureninase
LKLNEWNVDFAAWCSYKYVNSGAGAVAGAFVHERHLGRDDAEDFQAFVDRPRFEGWWGNDPDTRFEMGESFVPVKSADAWQLSNPPIMALAPVRVSFEIFDDAGMQALRAKSEQLTAYLLELIDGIGSDALEVITPRDPAARGCQLSILVHDRPRELFATLKAAGVICDFREPNVIRVAPTPLYNTFHDCWAFTRVLEDVVGAN